MNVTKQKKKLEKRRKKLHKRLLPKFNNAQFTKLHSLEPHLRGNTVTTKNIEVQMKGNLAYWAMDASEDCLYGYVAGKVDQAFYMEEDKFEAIYEIAWPIAEAIAPWFEKGGFSTWDIPNHDEQEVSKKIKTKNFKIEAWYLQGANDFSANIKRR